MLQVQNLSKSYGVNTVLAAVNLIVNDGEHVGLIGPNGSGKSTLLKIITGQEPPDGGTVVLSPRGLRVGYLAQSFAEVTGRTISEVIAAAQGELAAAETDLQQAADALTTAPDVEAAMQTYNDALTRYEALGGYEREHRSAAILQGLGLGDIPASTRVGELSGGQKTRLGLATLLMQEPELLLLD
ncbi:MAG TPA: ATP-binding cassette domain-containing protein [Chloroflexia bacterium]|nr:ATP-binding cassette domain-containing protein [Chloroflexia bacterium]